MSNPPLTVKEQEFREILEQHQRLLYKVAGMYTSTPQDREDLVQEIMIQVWMSMERYDSKFARSTWLYRIALNVSISWARKKSVQQYISESEFPEHVPEEAVPQLEALQQAIRELAPMDRAIILLYLDELPQAEIAQILGMSISNVSTRVHRIKAQLEKLIQQQLKNKSHE